PRPTRAPRLGGRGARPPAIGPYRTKLDDDFNVAAATPAEADRIRAGMEEVEARITRDMDPVLAARQMDTDEVVTMAELREYLEAIVEMSYQAYGYRRIKNARIWSLHDLKALSPGARRARRRRWRRWSSRPATAGWSRPRASASTPAAPAPGVRAAPAIRSAR